MKYVSLTFDDGRKDNYSFANSILRDYKMNATLYCTTGFVDGTFEKPLDWKSAGAPLSVEQILRLEEEGWEIALHGDQHLTSIPDSLESIKKLKEMGIKKDVFGFSLPNSEIPQSTFSMFKEELYPQKLSYIRGGRGIDTNKFNSKMLFAMYTIANVQKAYNLFNRQSIIDVKQFDLCNLPTVVIRHKDKPKMILEFLKSLPDDSWIIFMLHSILPKDNPLYGTDPWNWSTNNFAYLVDGISKIEDIKVDTVLGVMNSISQRDGDLV